MNYDICVIGSESLVFPFLQFGFTTYRPHSETALREYLNEAIRNDVGIIYIEDRYCFWVKDIIEKNRESLTPIFVPIGESEEGESFSNLLISEMMVKAVGISVI